MIGQIIGTVVLIFLVSFAVGTAAMIVKELISRKKRAASSQNNTDEKEVDHSNSK